MPNVDSVLVGLERTGPPAPAKLRELVSAGFAHRRKVLTRALAMAGADRERVRAALRELGLPEDARAEALSAAQWRALHERLSA